MVLAFEESIGFCCGDVVNDKDGVSAAAVFAEMAVDVYARGSSVAKHLHDLYERYGHYISRQGFVTRAYRYMIYTHIHTCMYI